MPARLRGKPLAFLSSALRGHDRHGGLHLLQHEHPEPLRSNDEEDERLANYEKEYSKYIGLPQPTLTDIKLDVDLQPSRRFAQFDGSVSLRERDSGADRDSARPHAGRR